MKQLKEKINAVSRRSLDGSIVMSIEEWNGIAELVEKLLVAAPTSEVVQVEPVSAQHRFRHPQKSLPDWSGWQPTTVSLDRPSWEIDSQGYEVEYRLLYDAPQSASALKDEQQLFQAAERIVLCESTDEIYENLRYLRSAVESYRTKKT